jgi:hypothetical protein
MKIKKDSIRVTKYRWGNLRRLQQEWEKYKKIDEYNAQKIRDYFNSYEYQRRNNGTK